MALRLAIVTSHPIQYQVPLFQALASRPDIELCVFFCHRPWPKEQANAGFGVPFEWDVPLLDRYPHRFLANVARRPTVNSFFGLDTPEIVQILQSTTFDAVLVSGWHYKSYWQTFGACWRTGIPVMVRGDSHLHHERGWIRRAARELSHRVFIPRFDACIAAGQWSSEYFQHYGGKSDRIFVVPHTPDRDRIQTEWSRLQEEIPTIRSSWNLPLDAVVFLFAGKFLKRKRPGDFIDAIHLAALHSPNIYGLMAGDGPLLADCRRRADRLSAPVRFTGFLNQTKLVRAYAAVNCLVLPSELETWGVVVNDAMICGLPSIVSDCVGCSPELARPYETGIVYPAGEVPALAAAMRNLTAHRTTLDAMSSTARIASASFSPEAAAGKMADAVRSIVDSKRAGKVVSAVS